MSVLSMPSDPRRQAKLSRKLLERAATWPIADNIELGGRFHSGHRMEQVVDTFLLVQTTYKEQPCSVSRVARLKEIRCHGHWRNLWMHPRNQCLRFLLEPARNGRHRRGMFEHVSE